MAQLSFLFYLNWKDQIMDLEDEEFRRFINNLINFHLGEEVVLITKIDRILWHGVLPGLQANQRKYIEKVEASSENGKLGGAPKENQNARKHKTTQNKLNKVIRDNSKKVSNKSEEENENRKMETENWQQSNVESQMKNEKSEEENGNNKLITENWQQSNVESQMKNVDFEASIIEVGKMEIEETISNEKSLEDLQAEYMTIGGHLHNLKEKMISVSPRQKNIQRVIINEDWTLLESNLNAEEFACIKPLLEEFNSLKNYSSKVYQDIVIKYNAAKTGQETND